MRTKTSPPLILREHEAVAPVLLARDEAAALRELSPRLEVAPAWHGDGGYEITTTSWIGAIQVGERSIEVRPKVPISRVLFLIGYTLDPRGWLGSTFDFEVDDFVEAIASAFSRMTARALRRGVLQGYRTREESLPVVRGRVRFDDQVRRRYGRFPPAEVRFDEFTEDIDENRILRAAIHGLRRTRVRSPLVRRTLRVYEHALANVTLVRYAPGQIPDIRFTRLNEHYRPAIRLARLILEGTAIIARSGRVTASAFLVDMNRVFEDFVVVALREALGASDRTFPQGASARGLWLDEDRRVRLRPDLSWWSGPRCLFVGDVKYKRLQSEDARNADLYQLLAYTVAARLPSGLLIYAAGAQAPAAHRVRHAGKRLEVRALNLSETPEQLLSAIGQMARRIRDEASSADTARSVTEPHLALTA